MPDPKAKILVVEGDPLVARMIVDCLRPLQVEPWAVHSGQEALAEAQADAPSLILVDALLPDLDGFTVVARLKQDAATRDVPIVFVTSAARMEDRVRALELGAVDCLTKPFYYEEVRARVQTALQRAAARPPAAPAAGIQGRLREISLPNVIQILEAERKTGTLELDADGERGALRFADGQIVGAQWRGKGGEFAAYRLIRWTEGAFRFVPEEGPPPEGEIQSSNQHLLMEAMRRLDEGERLLAKLPPTDRPIRTTARLAALVANRRPTADLKQLLDLIDGRRTIADILDLLPDDLQALEVLVRLSEHGFIEAA